jgi:hypothetical protein
MGEVILMKRKMEAELKWMEKEEAKLIISF